MTFTRREFLGCSIAGLTYSTIPRNIFIPGKKVPSAKFIYLTDLHVSEENRAEESYEKILRAIKSENVNLIVGGGDWINNGNGITVETAKDRFTSFKQFWSSIELPKLLIPGNHDFVRTYLGNLPSLDLFRSELGAVNTSLEMMGVRFLSIQSLTFSNRKEKLYRGEVDEEQLKWLQVELENIPKETPIVLVTHMPIATLMYQITKTSTAYAPEDRVITNSDKVLELFKDHNLALVLQGHLHVSEFMKWRETTFITGGALCGKWWEGSYLGTPPGFGVVTFENGGINWKYLTY